MIRKTQAIVLSASKFGETSLVATLYTREFGRQSFLVKGARSPKAKKRHSFFQPMSIIDIVFFFKESRDLQIITENSNAHFLQKIQTDPVRIALGLAMMEVFYHSVKEQEQNIPLFEFLKENLVELDNRNERLVHVFLHYLLHLTPFLGFGPQIQLESLEKPVFFNPAEGVFRNEPTHRLGDRLLLEFLVTERGKSGSILFSNDQKREMVSTLMQFYRHHVEGFKLPTSMEVFAEVFS